MANSYFKGHFVSKNAAGTVKLAGLATSTNDVMSASFKDNTKVDRHLDAGGVPRSLTKDFHEYTINLTLTPGVGWAAASTAAAVDAYGSSAQLAIGDDIILASFTDGNFNRATHTGYISAIGKSIKSGDLESVDIEMTVLTDAAGTAIDFSSTAWATL